MVLGLLWSGNAYAQIRTLSCTVNNPEINFEINDRIFDIKKGHYISIKKRTGSETKYTLNKFSELFSNKFKMAASFRGRLQPFEGKLLKDYPATDLLLMPLVHWNNEDNFDPNSRFIWIKEFIDEMLVHACVELTEKNYSKKEYKKLKKKTKTTTAFELIETYARESKDTTSKLEARIIEKEKSLNQVVKKQDINHTFSFEDKSGQKISKNSGDGLWKQFWGTVGYVLYEYGDIILDAAIEAKYGSTQQTNTPKMKCVSQRVGSSKMVHTTCRQIN